MRESEFVDYLQYINKKVSKHPQRYAIEDNVVNLMANYCIKFGVIPKLQQTTIACNHIDALTKE